MAVGVFVEGLGVGGVAGVWIDSVKAVVGGVGVVVAAAQAGGVIAEFFLQGAGSVGNTQSALSVPLSYPLILPYE